MTIISMITSLHNRVFAGLQAVLGDWFLPTAARFLFAAILLRYYMNSALTKVGSGIPGMFIPTDGAYAQILPSIMEKNDYDVSQIATIPYGLIVLFGTYGEFVLPILIIIGLFSRLAALGMIVFVIVQSYVDIAFHGLEAKSVGAWFDGDPSAIIWDQRALWIFLLAVVVIKGPGFISFDALLGRRR